MTTEPTSPSAVDEGARRRFEAAWRDGTPGPVEGFLPPEGDPLYRATLVELVLIDLELRWKHTAGPGDRTAPPALVEEYLARFPALDQPATVLRLLRQEHWVRCRWGDRPTLDEYRARFPEVVGTDDPFEETRPAAATTAEGLPEIPGYELLGILGRGGMGVVYRARQTALSRVVALKMLLAGEYARSDELARFRREAEAVARLQHPHIIHIYEVGEAAGRPYFSLEFAAGGNLAQRLAGEPQPARTAAHLAETLARAVEHAHRQGIVHRDLKPTNILHTADGTPKVADFGLARLLEEGGELTLSGTPMGTPSYMAPEQAQGQRGAIGPATDVYGLGAILYELLTGRPPFRGVTVSDTMHQVQTADPVPPRRLQPQAPRDLEIICLKCLEKAPERRYASAEELADDLGRFLAGQPIRARPASAWHRGLKWARRRPAAAALLAVTLLAATAGAAGAVWHNARLADELARTDEQRRRALANYQLARDAVDRMLTRVGQDRLAYVPQMEQTRREILEDALAFMRRFLDDNHDDPALRHEAAAAYSRVAHIHQMLDNQREAERAFQHALDLLEALAGEYPREADYRNDLAYNHDSYGLFLQHAGRFTPAEAALRRSLELRRGLRGEFPGEPKYRKLLAASLNNLGIFLTARGDYAAAGQAYDEAVPLYRDLRAASPSDPGYRRLLAVTLANQGNLLATTARHAAARQAFNEAVALQEKLVEEDPRIPQSHLELAGSLINLGNLLAESDPAQARAALDRAREKHLEKLVNDFPNVPLYRRHLGHGLNNLGLHLYRRQRLAEAQKAFDEALRLRQKLAEDFPTVPDVVYELALVRFNRGMLWAAQGRSVEAGQAYRAARAAVQQLANEYPTLPDYRDALSQCGHELGVLLLAKKRLTEADEALWPAVEVLRKLVDGLPEVPTYRRQLALGLRDLGRLRRDQGRKDEAVRVTREGLDHLKYLAGRHAGVAAYRQELAGLHMHLSNLLWTFKKGDEAIAEIHQAIGIQKQLVEEFRGEPAYRQDLARHHFNLGLVYRERGRWKESITAHDTAARIQEELVGDHPAVAEYRRELGTTLYQLADFRFRWTPPGTEKEAAKRQRLADAQGLAGRAVTQQRAGLKLDDRDPQLRRGLRNSWSLSANLSLALGEHEEVPTAAANLPSLYPDNATEYYVAGWFLARCVPLARQDPTLAADQQEELARAYADRAVAWIREAVRKGYNNVKELKTSPALKPLRKHEGFRAILRELERPSGSTPPP